MKYLLSAVLIWSAMTVSLQAKSTKSFVGTKSIHGDVKHSKVKNGTTHEINYQGWIGDASDTNGITDVLDMKFRLYDDSTGGTLLWNETQSAVSVDKGIFNVLLGSVTPIPSDKFTGDPLWLETQVENDTLSPRKKLVSVGYAIKSEEAEHSVYSDTAGYAVGGTGDNDWTISGNNMYSAVPGNVGIGVTSPTEKLDVNGAINVSSSYKIGGDRVFSNAGTGNIFVGVGAGENITVTGGYNTFVGDSAGYSNTGGGPNTFLGYYAGYKNTTGACNTFLGDWAGYKNTTGLDNTFSGHYAGYGNTEGDNNTFLGSAAGFFNTEGYDNTFLGHCAGFSNKTGGLNTFLGRCAGFSNTTGAYNTFSGYYAGYKNTTGQRNTFSGNYAGYSNTTGQRNTFSGYRAGYSNTTGQHNTFSGYRAGYSNIEGDSSVFIGNHAGYTETGSNKLYIANDSDDANVLIYGEFDNRRVGLRTTSPTAALDVNGANGCNQIRMRTSFTPTATSDARGNTGDIAWDDDCIYIKTGGGWKRATLSTF